MKRILGFFLMVISLGLVQTVGAADIAVLTQNQYLGAGLTPLFTAPTPAAFNEAAVAALQQIAATQPADRIKALAAEIAKAGPALVGLQEVDLFQCTNLAPPPTAGVGCDDASIRGAFVDHLQGTVSALDGSYVAAAIVTNLSVEVALFINGFPVRVVALDRDVILARSDIPTAAVDFTGVCPKPSAQGCNYDVVLPITLPFSPPVTINVERGFVAVDATVDGKVYRFVNTHLEEKLTGTPAAIQVAQAAELIQILQATTPQDRSLLLVGDTNSSPVDPPILGSFPTPYTQFIAAGYSDAWLLRPGKVPGFTCCQEPDLANHKSELYERVDMVFSLEPPARVKQARVLGATVSDKTPPHGRGLWPSDHGAVSGELQFP